MAQAGPVLTFQNVSYSYVAPAPSAVTDSLRNCSFSVSRGEWVAVMGANGSGKSTLARLAAGLLSPREGHVDFLGQAPYLEAADKRRGVIGYLSQHPEHHVVGLTVADDVSLGPIGLGLSEEETRRRTDRWLAAVGMDEHAHKGTDALSGGELQRVALAGVLAMEPDLLILDEPTAFADPAGQRFVLEVVKEFRKNTGAAVLWITHHTHEALAADRVLVLQQGKTVYDGVPVILTEEPEFVRAWGIGPPEAAGSSAVVSGEIGPADSCSGATLAMKGVSFRYEPSQPFALQDVNVTVRAGERVALVGPSGAGKSTLLQVAALLDPPTQGEVHIFGKRVAAGAEAKRSRRMRRKVRNLQSRIGLAVQQPEDQLFGLTVRDDFIFGLRSLGIPQAEWDNRIVRALESVQLSESLLDRSPFALSGGERRKVALALLFAQQPDLYLLDEPTAGLDYPGRLQVAKALQQIGRDGQSSVLLATHDPGLVRLCATRTVSLSGGRVMEGTVAPSVGSDEPARPRAVSPDASPSASSENRVDPRLHILAAVGLALSAALTSNWYGLAAAAAVAAFLLVYARLSLRKLRLMIRGLLPFALAAALFAGPTETAPLEGSWWGRVHTGLFVGTRMLLVVLSVVWVTHRNGFSDLLRAMQSLLSPLARLRVPVRTLVAATLVGARLIPVIGETARKIYRAQVMRGIERSGGWQGFVQRITSLAVPLTAAVLRQAEHLGEALALRGITASDMLPVDEWKLHRGDWTFILGTAVSIALILLCNAWGG